jgi:hypothetical protein
LRNVGMPLGQQRFKWRELIVAGELASGLSRDDRGGKGPQWSPESKVVDFCQTTGARPGYPQIVDSPIR